MITINMNRKCKLYKKPGVANGGYCLACILKLMKDGKFDHIFDKVINESKAKREK